MLHRMGYEHTCPECWRPCKDDDIDPNGEHCIGCKGNREAHIKSSTEGTKKWAAIYT